MMVKRILAIILLLFLTFNLTMPMKAVGNVNEIAIRKNGIEWVYIAPRMLGYEHQKLFSKNLTVAYNRASYAVKSRLVGRGLENSSVNMSLVFVGYERAYFRLTFAYPDVTVAIDSNIVVGENGITVQWFSIKTRRREYVDRRGVINYTQLNKHVAKAVEVFNLSMVKSYSAYALKIATEFELIEVINAYDIVIDKDLYVQDLGNRDVQGYECGVLEEIPAYAWIRVDKVTSLEEEVVVISITSLSTNGMHDGVKMSRCVIPLLSILLDIVESVGTDTHYSKVIRERNINVKDTIAQNYKTHIKNVARYIRLFEELVNGTSKDAYIRTGYVVMPNELHLNVVVDNIDIGGLDPYEARGILLKVLEALSEEANEDLNWQNILNEASVRIVKIGEADVGNALESSTAKRVVVLTYIFVLIQTATIAVAILSTLRPKREKS